MCMYSNGTNTSVIQSICKYSNCSTKANSLPFTWPEKQLFNSPVTFLVTFNFVPKQQQFSDKKLLSWAEQILLILIYCLSRLGYDASQHFRELLRSIQKNVYSQTVSYSTKFDFEYKRQEEEDRIHSFNLYAPSFTFFSALDTKFRDYESQYPSQCPSIF